MIRIFILQIVGFLNFALAECPPNQTTFSMIYPAKVVFISEDIKSSEPHKVPALVITKILNELKNDSPKIIFSGTGKTYSAVKKLVTEKSGSIVDDKLILYETHPAQFQLDVFESFYDEKNKSILIRQFEGYTSENKGPSLEKLSTILNTENIKVRFGGKINQYDAWLTGVGGNVESVSFGLN